MSCFFYHLLPPLHPQPHEHGQEDDAEVGVGGELVHLPGGPVGVGADEAQVGVDHDAAQDDGDGQVDDAEVGHEVEGDGDGPEQDGEPQQHPGGA